MYAYHIMKVRPSYIYLYEIEFTICVCLWKHEGLANTLQHTVL